MSRARFEAIMRFLHFGDGPTFAGDRLGKVRLLINHLNQVMSDLYVPDENVSLDDSMMLWRGRLLFRQDIKNERPKYGIKYYELCNHDGLILRTFISGQSYEDSESLGQMAMIVNHLMNDFLDKGYHVFTDNYYNSLPLTHYVKQINGYYRNSAS